VSGRERIAAIAAARAAVLAIALAVMAPRGSLAAPPATDDLAAYREMARGADAARLLARARATMAAEWDGAPPAAGAAPDWPGAPVGVYVSLVRGHATRACVGSAEPVAGSLGATLDALARAALGADPRHPPVRRDELDSLRVVITFAGAGRAIADPYAVDPGREALLVSTPRGSVAFLPGEARTVSWALREARRLGLLVPGSRDASYRGFPVVTLAETEAPIAVEASDALR